MPDSVAKADMPLEVKEQEGHCVLRAHGPWTIDHSAVIDATIKSLPVDKMDRHKAIVFDLGDITRMDTTGAWLVYKMQRNLRHDGLNISLSNVKESDRSLIDSIAKHDAPCPISPPVKSSLMCEIEDLGKGTVGVLCSCRDLLGYMGMVVATAAQILVNPRRMRWASLFHHMEHTGLKAMPIVGLMSLLIGIVIAQQGEFQLRRYGGDVFVVDLLAVTILREIGILLTAIMVAGRSGSAFTAQIGTMVLNEEVDAMRALGIDPIETLVLPRVVALMIMLPILTFYADIVALLGGGIFAWMVLDIEPGAFIRRLNQAITFDTFMVGMYKAPFFAAMISIAGCFEGMQVKGGAESVGFRTTRSVVESIFIVIIIDALFAIFFSYIGI